MKNLPMRTAAIGVFLALLAPALMLMPMGNAQDKPAAKPSLTVNLISPQRTEMPFVVQAAGGIAAWQEASLGAETGGLRVAEVRVNAGDTVTRGQVLATFATESVEADLAQARASLAEAEARYRSARALVQEPEILLADEPTGNLDARNSTMVFDLLTRLAKDNGQAVVLVTHNPEIASRCDATRPMRDGVFI